MKWQQISNIYKLISNNENINVNEMKENMRNINDGNSNNGEISMIAWRNERNDV